MSRLIPTLSLSVAIALSCAALTAPAPAEAAGRPKTQAVKVMSFNIHHAADHASDLDVTRTAKVVTDSGAEVVGLQEVDNHWGSRSEFADQATELAEATGMKVVFGANLDNPPVAGQTENQQFGTAILSKYPIVASQNHLLTSIDYPDRPTEQRGLLTATVNVHGVKMDVFNTHFDHQRAEQRELEVTEVLQHAGNTDHPIVLTGDLNAGPTAPEIARLATTFTDTAAALGQDDAYTYPVEEPNNRIDYVMARAGAGGSVKPTSTEVINTLASDHRPVLSTIEVTAAPGN